MKKILTLIVCICFASVSFAQLRVYPSGKVGIARDTTATARALLNIGNGTLDGQHNISLYSSLPIVRGSYNICIDASALSLSPDDRYYGYERAIGVRGLAGNSPDGLNFGVMGSLIGDRMGAGIYGAVDTYRGNMVDGYYAGYFDGLTKVNGSLIVTGGIESVLLSAAANESNAQIISLNDKIAANGSVSETLSGLSAITYYKETTTAAALTDNDTTSSVVRTTYNNFEAQDYSKKHYALSASQLAEVYPDLVYEAEDGSKLINYVEMIPLLVQSINELNAEIAALKGSKAKTRSYDSVTDINSPDNYNVASLSQNDPNPFEYATNIEMQIPDNTLNALFCIYDLNGKQIKQTVINERGKTTLNITSEDLKAGMYLYSLIIDGTVVETRRMILTK